MKRTRICDLLGIEYPIIQAPMAWITWAELAAAVSNAGATTVTTDIDLVVERLRNQIREAKSLTQKPFAVNFPIGMGDRAFTDMCIEVAIKEGIAVAVTSMGSPALYTERFHQAGTKVLHVVASVMHAQCSEASGVDAVVADSYEAGGYSGFDELTTFVLVPQIVDAVEIPVVAAGGIADARGFIAALALGADGVYMGTRFLATHECAAHYNFKKAVVEATDTSTISWGKKTGVVRTLKNELAKRFLEKEQGGASREELLAFLASHGGAHGPAGLVEGDIVRGFTPAGAVAGMITEIVSAEEVVRSLVDGAEAVLARLQRVGL